MKKLTTESKKTLTKLSVSLIILILIIIIGYLIFRALGLTNISREALQEYINQTGVWAPIIFIIISFLQVTIIPIPGSITILAGSYLFGFIESFIYSLIGMFLGGLFAFFLGRILGKKFVYWVAGDKQKVEDYLTKMKGKETVILFFMFLFPFFPDDLLCMIAGITSISWKTYIIMQIITRITSIGATLIFLSGELIPYHDWGIPVIIAISILGIIAFIYSYKYADQIQDWFTNLFTKKKHKEKS